MSVDGKSIVERLYERWGTSYEELCASYSEIFSAGGTYVTQQDTPPAHSAAEALALIEGFHLGFGVETIDVDSVKIDQVGNRVWTERVDHMVNASGERFLSIAIAGYFDFADDGTLLVWSDYWDMRGLLALAPAPVG